MKKTMNTYYIITRNNKETNVLETVTAESTEAARKYAVLKYMKLALSVTTILEILTQADYNKKFMNA